MTNNGTDACTGKVSIFTFTEGTRLMLDPKGPQAVQVIRSDIFFEKLHCIGDFLERLGCNFSQLVLITDSKIVMNPIRIGNRLNVWNNARHPEARWSPPKVRKLKRLRLSFSTTSTVRKPVQWNMTSILPPSLHVKICKETSRAAKLITCYRTMYHSATINSISSKSRDKYGIERNITAWKQHRILLPPGHWWQWQKQHCSSSGEEGRAHQPGQFCRRSV